MVRDRSLYPRRVRARRRWSRMSSASSQPQRRRGTGWLALLVVVALAAGLAGGLIVRATGWGSGSAASNACSAEAIAQQVEPSVVTISVTSSRGQPAGTGSGEFIRKDGYVLTNDHVVSPAANGGSVEITRSDGQSLSATIVGRDPQTDLAVLKASDATNVQVISIGSSGDLAVGQPVIAFGAPLGLSGSVTSGIVSALGRSVTLPSEQNQSALLVDAIQTDAAINPGNSGGALVNCSGELVGVPTAGATVPSPSGQSSAGNIGIGFAIPVNLATLVSDEIIQTGRVSHAYLGIQVSPVPASAASQTGSAGGFYVTSVSANGPAADAGIRRGDVITEVDGEPATSTDQLVALTISMRAGDRVELKYQRGGESHSTTLTLGSQPS